MNRRHKLLVMRSVCLNSQQREKIQKNPKMNTQEINRIVRSETIHMSAHNDVISMVVIPIEVMPMEVVRVELLVQTFETIKERIEQETDLILEGVLDLEEEINTQIEIVVNNNS